MNFFKTYGILEIKKAEFKQKICNVCHQFDKNYVFFSILINLFQLSGETENYIIFFKTN